MVVEKWEERARGREGWKTRPRVVVVRPLVFDFRGMPVHTLHRFRHAMEAMMDCEGPCDGEY